MTFPHTLQERKGPFACPRCGSVIQWMEREPQYLEHTNDAQDDMGARCTWLGEATDEQVEALK
jgi:DNA-directed RNA polymerase subunit RPC12/RpoP